MRIRAVTTLAVLATLITACSSSGSSEEIQANQKSLVSTLGRDIATFYVDSNEVLTLDREGDIISLVTESGTPLVSYELTGVGADFEVGDVSYRVPGDPAGEWCIDIGYGDGPTFKAQASDTYEVLEGSC